VHEHDGPPGPRDRHGWRRGRIRPGGPGRPEGGLATIAFGVVLCARPGLGAVTLALLFGLFNLIAGTWMLVQGIDLRRTGKTLQRPAGSTAPGPGRDSSTRGAMALHGAAPRDPRLAATGEARRPSRRCESASDQV
jgi:hypothetical protein